METSSKGHTGKVNAAVYTQQILSDKQQIFRAIIENPKGLVSATDNARTTSLFQQAVIKYPDIAQYVISNKAQYKELLEMRNPNGVSVYESINSARRLEVCSRAYLRKSKTTKQIATAALLGLTLAAGSVAFKTSNASMLENIQLIEHFNHKTTNIETTIKAVPQKDTITAYYFINGATDKGWWYQSGLKYTDHNKKFAMVYEIWNNKGESINNEGKPAMTTEVPFMGEVNPGDKLRMSLEINKSSNAVRGFMLDLNTGAYARFEAEAHGSVFGGSYSYVPHSLIRRGEATSLMTELWVEPNYKASEMAKQTYTSITPHHNMGRGLLIQRRKDPTIFVGVNSLLYGVVKYPTTATYTTKTAYPIGTYIIGRPSSVSSSILKLNLGIIETPTEFVTFGAGK
jgi:hypothetical protein